jgi:hypothetical protein
MYAPGVNPMVGVWLALLICAFVGWLVNKLSGRPRMNWAAWLAGWYVAAFLLSLVLIATRASNTAYELGRHTGMYLVPAVLSFIYARHWRQKHPMVARAQEMKGSDAGNA